MMPILDLPALDATPLTREPYDHMIVPGFIRAESRDAVTRDFPPIRKHGLFPLSVLRYGAAFTDLLGELAGPEFEAIVAAKFGVALTGLPKLFTVRGRCAMKDGKIHTDSLDKVVTLLLYLNSSWEAGGGRLRVLRSATNLSDYAAEIPPMAGTLLLFRRSERSFHGHEPFIGERRAIQMNWMTDVASRDREDARHRFSARIKQLVPFA